MKENNSLPGQWPITKKLPLLITLAFITSISAVGVASHLISKAELERTASENLSSLARSRSNTIRNFLNSVEEDLELLSSNDSVILAAEQFSATFAQIPDAKSYLQRQYIFDSPRGPGERHRLDRALDGSAYSDVHLQYHPWFKHVRLSRDYADVLIIDVSGNVVYSVLKETDFATNLLHGDWHETNLAKVAQSALARRMEGEISISDFSRYAPSNNALANFVSVPIIKVDEVIGALVFQLRSTSIDSLLRDGAGLGRTGEIFVVDHDLMIRGDSRGTPDHRSAHKPSNTPGIQEALAGRTGVVKSNNADGDLVLSAYYPLEFRGVRWAIVAEMAQSEIIEHFLYVRNWMLFMAVGFFSIMGAVGYAFARTITTPLTLVTNATQNLAGGDLNQDIPATNRADEIGAMARALLICQKGLIEARRLEAEQIQVREELEIRAEAMEDLNWIRAQVSGLSDALQQVGNMKDAAREILSAITPLMNGGSGAFYRLNDETESLCIEGMYASSKRESLHQNFELGEGIVGQCVLEQTPIVLTQAPEDYAVIQTGTGEGSPMTVAAFPIMSGNSIEGVLEIASFSDFTPLQIELLDTILPTVGLYLESLSRALRTEVLLQQTQSQAADLKSSEEELQASNDEMQRQAQQLERKTIELQETGLELREGNEELLLKTHALEEQQSLVEQARQEAEERSKELQTVNQYKSDFMANMSHELRTPLNSLLILSRSLSDNRSQNLDEDEVESARIIYDSGSHLLSLINDILDLSKSEAGKTELILKTTSIRNVAENARRRFDPVAQDKNVELTVSVSDDLPEYFTTDSRKLHQILNNLLSNALKFTEEGSVNVQFSMIPDAGDLGMKKAGDHGALAISVSDTGIGIPANKLDQVFEAFKQVDASISRKYGGTGLGLTITQSLCDLLDGGLKLESVEGVGTTFTVYLNLSDPEALETFDKLMEPSAPIQASLSQSGDVETIAKPGFKASPDEFSFSDIPMPVEDDRSKISSDTPYILIVEDDLVFAKIVRDAVRERGLNCVVSSDGRSGLTIAQALPPTGIVLDINLPELDGWSVLSSLQKKTHTARVPVHIISAINEEDSMEGTGAIGFLGKPVSKSDILDVLGKLATFADGERKKILVVEDDAGTARAISHLLESLDVELKHCSSGEDAVEALKAASYDCMILDLTLPGMDGFEVLKALARQDGHGDTPVVIYSARDLNADELFQIRSYTDSIVFKGDLPKEQLLTEVSNFLDRVKDGDPAITPDAKQDTSSFDGETVLVVDDDMRSALSLSKVLKARGLNIVMAKNGRNALDRLDQHPETALVLMDILMPEMDGYEALQRIRSHSIYKDKPVIVVSAGAMSDQREKCFSAGATDVAAKPIDLEDLVARMKTALKKKTSEA